MQITKDDFDQWKTNEVTREIFKVLGERKLKIAYGLADGGALIAPDNAVLVGRYKEIDDLITLTYEDMKQPEEE